MPGHPAWPAPRLYSELAPVVHTTFQTHQHTIHLHQTTHNLPNLYVFCSHHQKRVASLSTWMQVSNLAFSWVALSSCHVYAPTLSILLSSQVAPGLCLLPPSRLSIHSRLLHWLQKCINTVRVRPIWPTSVVAGPVFVHILSPPHMASL